MEKWSSTMMVMRILINNMDTSFTKNLFQPIIYPPNIDSSENKHPGLKDEHRETVARCSMDRILIRCSRIKTFRSVLKGKYWGDRKNEPGPHPIFVALERML